MTPVQSAYEREGGRLRLAAPQSSGIASGASVRSPARSSADLTCADAGSLYLVEGEHQDKLRFVLAQNDSLAVPFVEMVLDISSKTIVGYEPGGWTGALLGQPAAWSVPLALAVMVVVSLLTSGREPVHARRFLVRLHTPETLGADRT